MSFCETSLEFDLFEDMRRKVSRVLVHTGYEAVEADRIALYIMQGVRDVPKLLNALAGKNTPEEEIRSLLETVLSDASSLDRARELLRGDGERIVH